MSHSFSLCSLHSFVFRENNLERRLDCSDFFCRRDLGSKSISQTAGFNQPVNSRDVSVSAEHCGDVGVAASDLRLLLARHGGGQLL